eukprot:TRINITY_DN5941_c0_g1_i4.p1 TRINITY_DN5941_c0_g1~~TRINITY_DN5941_c0_g1_i4.p1  ORF type:complete len:214 (-),score=22.92 TRINITY_DN5941_c0_g1_i4:42-593(-)
MDGHLVAYLIWAFLPDSVLQPLGITYYPDRYWAVLGPQYLLVSFIFSIIIYVAINLMDTAPLDSFHLITGTCQTSRRWRGCNKVSWACRLRCLVGGLRVKGSVGKIVECFNIHPSLILSHPFPFHNQDKNAKEGGITDLLQEEGDIPPIADIPLTVVNELLYNQRSEKTPKTSKTPILSNLKL